MDALICSDPLVNEAMRYIRDHARQCLLVEDVAKHVNASRSTLIRRFDRALGRSVSSEINRLRVEAVKRELSRSRQPIAAISEAYGFSSAGQLSRFFKREVGVSPSDWRRGEWVPGEAVRYHVSPPKQ